VWISATHRPWLLLILMQDERAEPLSDGHRHLEPWLDAVRDILSRDVALPPRLPVLVSGVEGSALLLGDANCAADLQMLRAHGVTHVLNASDVSEPWLEDTYEEENISFDQLDAEDVKNYDMRQHLARSTEFIAAAREGGGACLVHCSAGINRSGFLVVAELIVRQRMLLLDAVAHCKSLRGTILTNDAFVHQLAELASDEGLLGERPNASKNAEPSETAAKSGLQPGPSELLRPAATHVPSRTCALL
jgi:protein-tyrosine phosphatase